jgi:hypothetical protein
VTAPVGFAVETVARDPRLVSTMARRDPTSRLNSADLPTLGRPTMAMSGKFGHESCASRCARPDGPPVLDGLAFNSQITIENLCPEFSARQFCRAGRHAFTLQVLFARRTALAHSSSL